MSDPTRTAALMAAGFAVTAPAFAAALAFTPEAPVAAAGLSAFVALGFGAALALDRAAVVVCTKCGRIDHESDDRPHHWDVATLAGFVDDAERAARTAEVA
jgi:hypothetical protein